MNAEIEGISILPRGAGTCLESVSIVLDGYLLKVNDFAYLVEIEINRETKAGKIRLEDYLIGYLIPGMRFGLLLKIFLSRIEPHTEIESGKSYWNYLDFVRRRYDHDLPSF